jgi:DNA-binding transcriptional MerR regulator
MGSIRWTLTRDQAAPIVLASSSSAVAGSGLATAQTAKAEARKRRSRSDDGVRDIAAVEKRYPEGLSSKQIIEVMERLGEPLTEATLRKYVQLGLLPRSRRVGEKGKHRGSRGIYPVDVIRRVHEIRKAMDSGETLEDLAAAQAVRAKVSSLRTAIEEALHAAESDLESRVEAIDKRRRSASRMTLQRIAKDARTWMKELERWSSDLEAAEKQSSRAALGHRGTGR